MRAPATTPSRSVGDACIVVEDSPAAHPVPPWKTQRAIAWRAGLPLFPPSVAPSTAPGTLQSEQAGCASSGGPSTASVEKEVPEPSPRKPLLWIAHETLNKQGLSLDCPRCEAVLRLSAAGGHSQKCQARIEKALDRNPLDRERLCAAPKKGRWTTVEDLLVEVVEEVEKRRRLEASIGRLEASIGRTSTATRTGASTSTRAGDRGARSSSDLAPAGAPPCLRDSCYQRVDPSATIDVRPQVGQDVMNY